MNLDIAELFIAFVLQNLGEQADFMVFSCVCSDSINDGCGPLDDKRLESILLNEVSVHKLLHSLDRKA